MEQEKGKTVQFKAEVIGTGSISQNVKWSIIDPVSQSTMIEDSGLLRVSATEVASSFRVKAVSSTDSSKSSTATITVLAQPVPDLPKPAPVKPKKDNIINVAATIKVSVNKKGDQKLIITDKKVKDLLKKTDKKRQKTKNNIVNLEIKTRGVKTSKPLDYIFTKKALKVLVDKKINSVTISSGIINVNMDSKAFKDIRKQTSGDATLTIAKKSKYSLSKKLQKVSYIKGAKYNAKKKVMEFTTNRLSKFGVLKSK